MDGTKNYEDMQITKVVAQYMNDEEWTDEIEVSDDRSASTVATQLGIEDQGYRLFLEANEVGEVFTVYMYSPFKVPANRIDAAAKILNRINRTRLRLGRLAVLDNGEASPIQFACSIDVEGGALAPGQIGTIIGVCFSLGRFHQLLSAVALTKMSEDKLWEEFVEEEERLAKEQQEDEDSGETSGDDGPNKL
jgi:hypothetical protein